MNLLEAAKEVANCRNKNHPTPCETDCFLNLMDAIAAHERLQQSTPEDIKKALAIADTWMNSDTRPGTPGWGSEVDALVILAAGYRRLQEESDEYKTKLMDEDNAIRALGESFDKMRFRTMKAEAQVKRLCDAITNVLTRKLPVAVGNVRLELDPDDEAILRDVLANVEALDQEKES